MLRSTTALAHCLSFAACASLATTVGFPAADADDNDVLSQSEFNEFFDDTDGFERFDDDDNGSLSRTEYNEAVDATYETDAFFSGLDRDHNSSLSRSEFLTGWFGQFDANKNGSLSRSEFEASLEALSVEL